MSDSLQRKLMRVRPPQVQITYDVETGGALEKKEVPFILGVIADLSADSDISLPPLRERELIEIDRDNFNDVLASIEPRLKFNVPNTLDGSSQLTIDLPIMHIDDFAPDALLTHIPALNTRNQELDAALSEQLNLILHHNDFQTLEASWRGLYYLVMCTEMSAKLKIRVLNASFDELYDDMENATNHDRSVLFHLINAETYDNAEPQPIAALIGDFQFGGTARDFKFLEMVSGIAASVNAPFFTSAYAKSFDIQDLGSLCTPRDLNTIFDDEELTQWRTFRNGKHSHYIALTLPRVMIRLPYHPENNPVESIDFYEDVAVESVESDGIKKRSRQVDTQKLLWGNPAYMLGQRITNAFAKYSWPAAILGMDGGGLLEGLPIFIFETECGDIAINSPTQIAIADRCGESLNEHGFIAICHSKDMEKAAFFSDQDINQSKKYATECAPPIARIEASFPYVLCVSRFAHYLKIIMHEKMREEVGSAMSRQSIEDFLNTWIAQYVLLDDTPSQDVQARYPLREARIEVSEVSGEPGRYTATLIIKPHFQLAALPKPIRMVVDLPHS